MKRLIVNADDFGLHDAVNAGIIQAHQQGMVTSASLMAGGEAFEAAVRLALGNPQLGVGVHLTLVAASPVLPPQQIPSLVDGQGGFWPSYPVFLARYLQGKICRNEVAQELSAQIGKIRQAGIQPTHLDSHQHLHVLPGLTGRILDLAKRFSVPAVRIPAEPLLFFAGGNRSWGRIFGRSGLTLLARRFGGKARAAGLSAPQHFFGMLDGGGLTEPVLRDILRRLPPGSSEIMTHPAVAAASLAGKYSWGYQWEAELQALTSQSLRDMLKQQKIQLINYREL